jgi:CHAT domain-containing protein
VDERVMRPVRALLADARHVFISPDGLLNLVPFAALVDEQGRYLVESYSITYLTSGRDLLRMQYVGESKQPPLVLGDPLFGEARGRGDAPSPPGAQPSLSPDAQAIFFLRLKGTADEARAVGSILAGARVLTQSQATEQAIKRASSPRVLHVATHGFFLPDQAESAGSGAAGGGPRVLARAGNPLARSGLALAGANVGGGAGGEDGILTALEASALDLWGTKLVVLSACETGVGEVKNGDGVYGLRRALVLAGSESQVMSLWKVSDDVTRDLMVAYYGRLRDGEGRTEALRRVQLEMLRGKGRVAAGGRARGIAGDLPSKGADRSHPYFWAAFIQSGDWRPMNARPAGAK